MKNRIFIAIIALILVFSNTISVLAFSNLANSFTNYGFSNQVATKPSWYICNKNTWQCELSSIHTNGVKEYILQSDCNTDCYSRTTVSTSYSSYSYVATTTTRPSYTYTTNPVANFVVTTTKPSYTYTTQPSINSYTYTTTTKPVVLFNNQINNQISNFVTTTTSPKYVYTTIPDYNSYIPTTTLPSYTYTTNPVARTFIPVTTIPQAINIPSIDYTFKPTTKPSFNIIDQNPIKSIDLRYAKPIIQPSVNILNPNIQNQDLTFKKTSLLASLQLSIDALKNDLMKLQKKDDEKLQTLSIGEEETKSTGEKYLIVVVPTVDKDLFKKYIEERKDKFDIKIVSLQENGVKNEPAEVLAFIQKQYNEFPYSYLVFHEKIKISSETAVWSKEYSKIFPSFAPYWNWREGIYFSRIRTEWLNKNNQGWIKLNSIMPALFLTHEYSNRYTVGICCDTKLPNYDNLIKNFMSNLNTKFFFENRGTFPITDLKVNFQSLNFNNFSQGFSNSNFVYANSTVEPISVWGENYNWKYSLYNEPYTLIWTDKDKNEHADNSNAEIATEKYWVNINDNLKRMVIVMGTNNFIDKDYVTFASNYEGDTEFFMPMVNQTVSSIYNNIPIAKAYRSAYDSFVSNLDPEYRHISGIPPGTFRMYGPPETTLNNLIEEPRVAIQPNSKGEGEYVVEIPKGKFEVDFVIKNIGKVDINYSFDKSNKFEITPIAGNILVNNEIKINLKVLSRSVDIQLADNIENNLKLKTGKIYFKSNAGDKELIVKYWDI